MTAKPAGIAAFDKGFKQAKSEDDAEKLVILLRAVMQAREQLTEWLELKVPGLPLDAYKGVRVARGILGTALRDVNAGVTHEF